MCLFPPLSPLSHTSPIQEEGPTPAVPTDVCSVSSLRPLVPATGGVMTREAERGLEACTLADTDLPATGVPADASSGSQEERMQTHPFGNAHVPSRNNAQPSCPLIRTVAW